MLVTGVLSLEQAVSPASIDFKTLFLLFGMMIVVGVLRLSGFFERLTGMALRRIATPKGLLAATIGLSLLAIKSDVDAASDVGVSPTRLQDLVLFLSGAMMGICGSFYGSFFSYIEPGDMFGFDRSISWVLMGVIGGIGTIFGPVLGAIIFVFVKENLIASYPQLYLGLYGTLLVLVILFEPLGLTGLFLRVVRRARPDLAVTGMAAED